MSNLNELVQYEPGIYQLETTDPVLGGPDGIDNLQGKQLANRTAYLKKHVDDLESGATVPPGIATQTYVQGELNKRDNKQSARAATTGNIALNAVQVIDGVNVQVGDRVLVKNQVDATQNGIYVVAAGGWTRALDADENVDVTAGMEVMVTEGALQADTAWKLTTNDPINLGVSLLSFADITTGYAPLASPNFSGTPTAPTQANADNSTKLATTGWVYAAMATIAAAAGFAVSFATNGYIKFPSWFGGLILQWGSLSVTSGAAGVGGTANGSFPVAFPSQALFITGYHNSADSNYLNAAVFALSASTYQVGLISGVSSLTRNVSWIAIGR